MYTQLGLPKPRGGSGATSGGRARSSAALPTDAEALKGLSALHPLPAIILEHRKLSKMCAVPL
jgi:DNA polymerase I-like protein with 3'-5' exonuclease and polymerase domains